MRENYWTRLKSNGYSRRRFLAGTGVAAAGTAAILAGCGDDDSSGSAATAAATSAATAAATSAATAAATEASAGGATDGSFYSQQSSMSGTTLDLHRELYRSIAYTVGNAYNNLIKFTDVESFAIAGEIATGLPEQVDELTYNFTIRDDVKWHNKAPANGAALTMDDVKWNIERQTAGELASGEAAPNFYRSGQIYSAIDTVDYVDATHFTVKMKEPAVTWLSDMAAEEFNAIMHPEVAVTLEDEANFGAFNPDHIVGTGAFVFDAFDPNTQAHASRNDDYHLRKDGTIPGMVDDYYITNIGNDPNALRLAFEQKQIDELSLRQKDIIEAVQEANPDVIRQDIGNPNNNLEFAYNPVVNAAFAIPSLAQAMFLAVDRAHVSNTVFQGLAKPNPGVNWPFKGWSLPQQELIQAPGYKVFQGQAGRDEDIAEARKLWEAGGGEDLPDETYAMIIVDLADQSIKEWFPAMMNSALDSEKWSVEAIPVSTLLEYNVSGQNPVGYLGGWDQWVSPDPRTRYASVYSSGPRGFLNFYGYHTDEMESYISKMFGTFDVEEAQQIMQEAQRFQLTDAGSGHVQMVGGVAMDLHHPYLHRRGPQFIQLGTLISQECWIDQNDPSFAGKSMPA